MRSNIFNKEDYTAVRNRIQLLNPESVRRWGRMTTEQMVAHCSIQLKLAMGMIPEQKPESTFLYRTFAGRWLSLYIIPWPRGFETPSAMDMFRNGVVVNELDTEKKLLLWLLDEVFTCDRLSPHPFYGPLRQKDWGRLIWVHLNHHLRQFSS